MASLEDGPIAPVPPPTTDLPDTDSAQVDIISASETLRVLRILMYYVTPAVASLGVIGNIFSLIILVKHGLHKCSNILLFCLAISDVTFLFVFNSPARIIYEVQGPVQGFAYSETVSFVLFVFYTIYNTLDYGMGYVSLTIPLLITIERLVAVFFPLRFNRIITPFRTWCAVAAVYVFWYTYIIFCIFWTDFRYDTQTKYNISLGIIERSDWYNQHPGITARIEQIFVSIGMQIPPSLTLVGCLAISVKIKLAASKRKKLASSQNKEGAATNRTTKMLLAVCGAYTLTCLILNFPVYLPEFFYFTLANDAPSNIGRITYQTTNIIICINSSINFVVYVGMNKNFRETYKALFVRPKCCKAS